MKNFKIVIGFKWEKTEAGIFKELKARDYKVESALRFNKTSIREYLEQNKDVDACILKEYLDGGGRWSAKELAELADDTDTNLVVVVSRSHKGREFIKELYAAGITSAVFSDGKFGVKPSILTDLAINKRGKREARAYYGMKDTIIQHGLLCYEDYMDHVRYMTDRTQGINIVDRFVTLSGWLYPQQMGAFIDMMPDTMLEILTQYKEFFRIYNRLRARGYVSLKLKTPKNLKVGITKDKLKDKYAEDNAPDKKEKEIEITPVTIEEEAVTQKIADDVGEIMEEERPLPENPVDDDIFDAARREKQKKERIALQRERRRAEREERKKKRLSRKDKEVEVIEEEQVLPGDEGYGEEEWTDDEDAKETEKKVVGLEGLDLEIVSRFQNID